eukprot:6175584-Pleurochrysis_carterae.AAC.1
MTRENSVSTERAKGARERSARKERAKGARERSARAQMRNRLGQLETDGSLKLPFRATVL